MSDSLERQLAGDLRTPRRRRSVDDSFFEELLPRASPGPVLVVATHRPLAELEAPPKRSSRAAAPSRLRPAGPGPDGRRGRGERPGGRRPGDHGVDGEAAGHQRGRPGAPHQPSRPAAAQRRAPRLVAHDPAPELLALHAARTRRRATCRGRSGSPTGSTRRPPRDAPSAIATATAIRCARLVSCAALLGLLGLLERLLEQAPGPRELERQHRERDRDHHERRPGQDQHRHAGEQQREAGR